MPPPIPDLFGLKNFGPEFKAERLVGKWGRNLPEVDKGCPFEKMN
jgi:hypothetical protein